MLLLIKLKEDDSREAYFTLCYLKELHGGGSWSDTQLLAANYKLANGMDLDKDLVTDSNTHLLHLMLVP